MGWLWGSGWAGGGPMTGGQVSQSSELGSILLLYFLRLEGYPPLSSPSTWQSTDAAEELPAV